MAISSFANIDGIPGPVNGEIELFEFDYEITMPTDLRDGTITGRRQHGFFSITHEVGKQSPLFAKHICENLEIPKVEVNHYREVNGKLEKYFSHVMRNVKVVGVRQSKPHTQDPASKPFADMETVRFMFEEITQKDREGTEYTDKWELG